MSTDTKAPSVGAMRFSRVIADSLASRLAGNSRFGSMTELEIWHAISDASAQLFDRHVAELVEALEEVSERDPCACIPEGCNHGPEETGCIGCVARRALRRFKEGL